ncbi:MAG: hypothetical protein QOJ00_2289 [Actinomycetota bacterium]|jgi:hypothetical protein
MKRLVLLAAVIVGAIGFSPAPSARAAVPNAGEYASLTNNLLSRIPGFGGGDTRHICLIYDKLDTSYCIYVPLP